MNIVVIFATQPEIWYDGSTYWWKSVRSERISTKAGLVDMLAEAHRQAAEDIEKTILPLQAASYAARVVIEGAWGAAFHWIAFGCETKHQNHQESHARLGTFLRRQGEGAVAEWWEDIDRIRQGGWYGGSPEPERVQRALDLLERMHNWAAS
jgi:hypothetical protein